MPYGESLEGAALIVAVLAAITLGLLLRRRARRAVPPTRSAAAAAPAKPVAAVVFNPTKVADAEGERSWLSDYCATNGWADPLWLATTIGDPGTGQTRQAVAAGADTVVAYGGDGTVRSVAGALAGGDRPLGILAAGTGNLLARNLDLPITDRHEGLRIALNGTLRRLDVATAEIDVSGEDQHVGRETFLVMAGLGFDAEVMASVEPELKERVGWWAYVISGLGRLAGPPTRVVMRLDDGKPLELKMRSVLIGNCGEVTGGLALMPDAVPDDGMLDVAVFTPRTVMGWGAVVAGVLARVREGHPVVQHHRCRSVEIRCERPLPVQLDGDPAGDARVFRARVEPGALLVRVP